MPVPDVTITVSGREVLLTETNTWVCLFTEASPYDHLYCYEPDTIVVFDCREVLTRLMELGYPLQTRRLPTEWDLKAYEMYIQNLTAELEHDLEEL